MPLNIDIQQILLHMLNFTVLFAALYFLLYKPVKNFMDSRENYYGDIEEKSEKAIEEANKAKAEYESKTAILESETAEIRSTASKEADRQAEKIIADAQQEASDIISKARAAANKEKEAIVRSASREIAELAQEAANKMVFEDSSLAYDNFLDEADADESGENE